MPLRTNTNSSGATVVVHGVGDSCGIICSQQRGRSAVCSSVNCTAVQRWMVTHMRWAKDCMVAELYLQKRNDEEVEVGNSAELLEQIHGQECKHREFGCPHAIMSRANMVSNTKSRQPAPQLVSACLR